MAGNSLGTAYVQVVPKLKDGSLASMGKGVASGFMSGFGDVLKQAAGLFASAAIVKGIYDIGRAAVDAYADYEQLVGGVETLFGDAQDEMLANAQNAFRTAGLSANEYMETVTSFSASLIQSLGGDTAEAARMADMAITDMADNANKMGTDMASIQNAYQGFAKQNYTMLDNLKLGYGGTKEEMERLLEDAERLKAEQGEYVDYSIDSYADVVEAIHVIQDEMGITGTTAAEAASTISGSWGMLKGAWGNLLVSIAGGGDDLEVAVQNVFESLLTWLGNLLPRIVEVAQGLFKAFPLVLEQVMKELPRKLVEFVRGNFGDDAADAALDLVNAFHGGFERGFTTLFDMLPGIMETAFDNLTGIAGDLIRDLFGDEAADSFLEFADTLKDVGEEIGDFFSGIMDVLSPVTEFFSGEGEAFGGMMERIQGHLADLQPHLQTMKELWDKFKEAFTNLVEAVAPIAAEFFSNLGSALVGLLPIAASGLEVVIKFFTGTAECITAFIEDAKTGFSGFKSFLSDIWEAIKLKVHDAVMNIQNKVVDTFNGIKDTAASIWNGIKTAIETPINKAKDIVKNAIDAIKGFFNFEFRWPHIPLPHFSITGSINPLDWLSGGLPQIGISWYGHGGFYDEPTVMLPGVGERGKEFVWPDYEPEFSKYAAAIASRMGGASTVNNYYIDGNLVAADAALAAALDIVAQRVGGRRRMGVA